MLKTYTFLLFFFTVLAFDGFGQTNYYSSGSVAVNSVTNWWTNTDGTGSNPANFTAASQIFNVQNGHLMTASALWTVSGSGSKVVIKSGGQITSGAFNHSLTLDMESGGTWIHSNTTYSNLVFGSLHANSNFQFNNASGFAATRTYPNFIINNVGINPGSSNMNINGNLIIRGASGYFRGTNTNSPTHTIGGDVIIETSALFTLTNGSGSPIYNISGSINNTGGSITNGGSPGTPVLNLLGSGKSCTWGTKTAVKHNLNINSSASYDFNDNFVITTGTLTVNGVLNLSDKVVSGAGAFTLSSGGTLKIGHTSGVAGNITVDGTKTFNANATYEFNGSAAQVTSASLPGTITGTLKVNNSSGVTLSQSTTATTVDVTSGNLALGSNNLTLTNLSITSPSATKMIIANGGGELRKIFTAPDIFTYPVGDNSATVEYSPVTLLISSGTFSSAYIGIKVTNTSHPAKGSGGLFLNRYWSLNASGITSPSYDVDFNYLDADVSEPANEANLKLGSFSAGTGWVQPTSSVNTTTNILSVSGLTSFSDFTGGEPGALPVELTSFTARVAGNVVNLNWETATEVDNNGFDVERNSTGTWQKIGFVEGHGTANSPKYYNFTDKSVTGNKIQYRLRQVDNDGTFEYSPVVEVELAPATFALDQNYPNPFNPSTIIRFSLPTASVVTLNVYNTLGEKVATLLNGAMESGYHQVSFDAANLPSGLYLYEIKAGEFSSIKKMLLMK